MDDCGVYALLNTHTGKVYVGSSVQVTTRYLSHVGALRRGDHSNSHLQRAWHRDADSFAVGLLECCVPATVRDRERYWLTELQAADRACGYNLNGACDEGFTLAPETRAKLSVLATGRKAPAVAAANRTRSLSPETRAKISAALHNRLPPSPETRAKLSAASRSRSPEVLARISLATRNRSPETRAKIAEARRGRPHSPETRAKIAEARRNLSPETRAKLSETSRNRSPETRAKLSAAARNRSPETRAKLSAGNRNREERRRAAASGVRSGEPCEIRGFDEGA